MLPMRWRTIHLRVLNNKIFWLQKDKKLYCWRMKSHLMKLLLKNESRGLKKFSNRSVR
ncbi:hypothetical protein Goklo_027891 [Gossypium klotzschianum]|uniref:Uncharacterized protein n=1 Tax=Gossypium klotzschianum TaxID=34286 RepID=A0A7J8TZQ0_9ROSI|nr:hypothetical protein [Gossypium klotzschianum]